jgi:hypothetical protein
LPSFYIRKKYHSVIPDGDWRSLVPYVRTNHMLMSSSFMGLPTGRPVQRLSMSSRDSVADSAGFTSEWELRMSYYASEKLLAYYASDLDKLSERETARMLKESNDELERVTKDNERLTAENASYAQVLESWRRRIRNGSVTARPRSRSRMIGMLIHPRFKRNHTRVLHLIPGGRELERRRMKDVLL